MKKILLLAVILATNIWSASAQKTAKAVFVAADSTLTFYYDDVTHSEGTVFAVPDSTAKETDVPWRGTNMFYGNRKYFQGTLIFDESFKDYCPKSIAYWFYSMTLHKSIVHIDYLNTSQVANMNRAFAMSWIDLDIDLSCWDVSNVVNLDDFFSGANLSNHSPTAPGPFRNLILSGWNLQKLTKVGTLFSIFFVNHIDMSNWNAPNWLKSSNLFFSSARIKSVDMSNFNAPKLTSTGIFYQCDSLATIDLSNFNTAEMDTLRSMFYKCKALETVDLSSFNTSNVTNMGSMFYGCTSLKTVYVSDKWTTDNVKSSGSMFKDCSAIVGEQGTTFNPDSTKKAFARIDGGTARPGYFSRGKETVTVSAAGIATLYSGFNLVVPAGVEVYGMESHGTYLNYSNATSPVAGDTLAACKGYLIKAPAGTYVFYKTAAGAQTADITSCLSGVKVDTPASKLNGTIYTLADGAKGLGFYKFVGDTLAAHKAYYLAPATEAKDFIGFEETTGIESLSPAISSREEAMYNLQGMRVDANYKGIVIKNGKKYINRR